MSPRAIVAILTSACYMLGTITAFRLLPPPQNTVFTSAQIPSSITKAIVLSASTQSTATPVPSPSSKPSVPSLSHHRGGPAAGSLTGGTNVGIAAGSNLPDLSPSQLNAELSGIRALGATWIRYDVSWNAVQPDDPSSYDWSDYDRVVQAVAAHGLKSLIIIDYTPAWAAVNGCSSFACEPASPAAFGNFAAAVAQRYVGYGIHSWEIWNEPNNAQFFQPQPDASYYTQLLKAAYPAIKAVDPSATILTAGLSPAGDPYTPSEFLEGMYDAGAAGYFTAVADHPYTYPVTAAYNNPYDAWGQMIDMHNVMSAHGQGNIPIWITEYGAPTGGPGPLATQNNYSINADHVTEALQNQMVYDFFQQAKALPWVGVVFWYSYQDTGTDPSDAENFYGLLRNDDTQKPAYATFVTQTANF